MMSPRELRFSLIESMVEMVHDKIVASGSRKRWTSAFFNIHSYYIDVAAR